MSRVSRSQPDIASGASGTSREIIFEFIRVGDQVKVAAVDSDTGVEAVVFGPASTSRSDLERLALAKLRYVSGKTKSAASSRAGKLV